jgi:hypothetical protein
VVFRGSNRARSLQSRHTYVEFVAGIRCSQRNNFRLALGCGVFNPKITTTPAQGIADASLFIRGQHNEGNAPGTDGA